MQPWEPVPIREVSSFQRVVEKFHLHLSPEENKKLKIAFSYSVMWEEHSDLAWASRWDTYLTMSDVQIHWFAICNSVAIVLFLSGRRGREGWEGREGGEGGREGGEAREGEGGGRERGVRFMCDLICTCCNTSMCMQNCTNNNCENVRIHYIVIAYMFMCRYTGTDHYPYSKERHCEIQQR